MVEKHIKSLLYDHDCVIIPEFGGLITRYVSARINPVKHTLSPPSKKIAFNEKLILNDGLLISTIAFRDSVSKEDAQQQVAEFVRQAKTTLHQDSKFILRDIGIFKYNAERRIEFEYIESDNLLEASFGLPELTARPIRIEEPAVLRTLIKERQQIQAEAKQPFKKRLKRAYNVAAGLALMGLSASALYFFSVQADYNLSSLNPIMLFNQSMNGGNTVNAGRYAADYVPLTEEERIANYQSIMPLAIQPEVETIEDFIEDENVEETESNALELSAQDAEEKKVKEVEIAPVENKTIAPVLTIKEKSDRFYIITGGYAANANAEVSRDAIRAKGHDAKVLFPGQGSKIYRVSVADFGTEEEARAAMNKYRSTFGETIWVFNY